MEVGIITIYPNDLTDQQWDLIKHDFDYGNYGKSRKYPIRTLVNAVFYIRPLS
ncbi:IS5 family transposase domain protein [Rickettsiales endosymbiont of Paramecium tredecaurelia]|nr:IS5 family transposase domain protein [Candidatus Sarmatiella mevalonica]